MKIYFYIFLFFLVITLFLILTYKGDTEQLPQGPLIINTDSVVKVEILYGHGVSNQRKKIKLSDFNKALATIKSYITPDTKPQKSCPWITFVLYKDSGQKNYLHLLFRGNDIMVQFGKNSWLISSKNRVKLEECMEEIISTSKLPQNN